MNSDMIEGQVFYYSGEGSHAPAGTGTPHGANAETHGHPGDQFSIPALADDDGRRKGTELLGIINGPEKALVPNSSDCFSTVLQVVQ
jgi:hypothetical protein